jgi:hypothetical protein
MRPRRQKHSVLKPAGRIIPAVLSELGLAKYRERDFVCQENLEFPSFTGTDSLKAICGKENIKTRKKIYEFLEFAVKEQMIHTV